MAKKKPRNTAAVARKSHQTAISTQIAARLPNELITRIDTYAAALAKQTGLRVSRAAAMQALITQRLDQLDQ